MEIKNTDMYIVTVAASAIGEAPVYNGTNIAGVYTTLEEARAKVRKIADEWNDYVNEDWKPGYCDDPDGSMKWAENYYAEDCSTAWHNGCDDNWERVEIMRYNQDFHKWVAA